jgi:hypothetical protein
MTLIRIYWAINALTFIIALYFFIDGLRSATDSSYFSVWAVILGMLLLGLPVSYLLYQQGQSSIAIVLAGIPACISGVIGLFFGLVALVVLLAGDNFRWN